MQRFQYRNPRFKVSVPLDIYLTPGIPLHGRCIDISAEGIGAELEQQIPIGRSFRLKLSVDGNSLNLEARVAYTGRKHCGMVFQFSSDKERTLVSKLLQHIQKIT